VRYGWRLMPSQVSSEPRSSRSRVVPPASGSYFSGIAGSREFRIARITLPLDKREPYKC
jgi:hypothetical protein